MDINNISPTTKANGAEGVDAGNAVETKMNPGIHNGNAIASVSYTAGERTVKSQQLDPKKFLESIQNFGDLVDPEAIQEDTFKSMTSDLKGILGGICPAIKECCAQAGIKLSGEVTEEDLQIQKEAQVLIDKLLSDGSIDKLLSDGSISDFDIRELMKILIKAFSALMNAQREIELNTMQNIILALQNKMEAMEKSRDANYKAAITQAVGQIVSGVIQIVGGVVSMIGACVNGKDLISEGVSASEAKMNLASAKSSNFSTFAKSLADMTNALGTITTAITGLVAAGQQADAKTEDIKASGQDAILEVERKTQEGSSNALNKLMESITSLMNALSSLLQSASSTEKTIVGA